MTDEELVKRLRYLGDHAAYEPDMHHTAADVIDLLTDRLAMARWLMIDAIESLRDGKIKQRRNRADIIDQVLKEWRNE